MTKLLYLEDWNQLEGRATVSEITTYPIGDAQGKPAIVLDQTIFYPQGGGQPWDTGTISGPNGTFKVEAVRFDAGIVYHIGSFASGSIMAGEATTCAVDKERRALHSRIHSGGHIVDMAVKALGLNWVPGKGYHFPEGPYIEYAGILGDTDKEKLKADIEATANKFITENRTVTIRFKPEETVNGKPARVVMYGDFSVPCGGTHVNSLGEVGALTIRKMKQDGEKIKIGYDVAR